MRVKEWRRGVTVVRIGNLAEMEQWNGLLVWWWPKRTPIKCEDGAKLVWVQLVVFGQCYSW